MTESFAPIHIAQITLRIIQLEMVEPFDTASGSTSIRPILLVEITDINGIVAWGECVAFETPGYMPETIDMAWNTLENRIAPIVLKQTFSDPPAVSKTLDRHIDRCEMAKAALEMACWDLCAQIQNMSLAALLGGTRDTVETGIAVGFQSSHDILVRKVQEAQDDGYCRIKLKIQPGQDVENLIPLLDCIERVAPIMVDANGSYSMQDLNALIELDALNLMMIEQPFTPENIVALITLSSQLKTPICLDESITSLKTARTMHEINTGRIINLKPGRVGGITNAMAIHDYCKDNAIPLWCGGMLESGIGRAFNVALASLPHFTIPGDLSPSKRYWAHDIVSPEWKMDSNGRVSVPLDKSGIGVDVDTDRIETSTVRKKTIKLTP
jgi:O-succinylbenzoate synthase